MHTLKQLRDTLLDAGIGIEPENISAFADKGTVRHYPARAGDPDCNSNFRLEYNATLVIINYARAPEILMHIVGEWYHRVQPGHKADGISYEAEILDHDSVDIRITIDGLIDTYKPNELVDGTLIINCANQAADPIIRQAGIVSVTGAKDA
ncbi:phage tail protein [Rappaport israeli]|uniref:phage tail protein n=1 Tax=Rappaport israeli TaxID=1839807 RepID=UPI000930BE95|nr:phage tail protein [Rappaport israeli]